MCSLAALYRLGKGVKQSNEEALKLYHKAIALGSQQAMYELAICHFQPEFYLDLSQAGRLLRLAIPHPEAAPFLSHMASDPVIHYHLLMSQKNYEEAATVVSNFGLEKEFLEFDCGIHLLHDFNVEPIKKFTACYVSKKNKNEKHNFYVQLLLALKCCEENLAIASSEFLHIKKFFLLELNLKYCSIQQILEMMQIIVDTWYGFSSHSDTKEAQDFLGLATSLLCKGMYSLKLKRYLESPPLFVNIFLIIAKSMYGENIQIKLVSITIHQLMLLIAFRDLEKPSISNLNQLLGSNILVNEERHLAGFSLFNSSRLNAYTLYSCSPFSKLSV